MHTSLSFDISAILTRGHHREELGDLEDLKASMTARGQLQPIIVRRDHEGNWILVAGRRRLEAAKQLGWKWIEGISGFGERGSDVLGGANAILAIERDENTCRKPFTASEMAALVAEMMPEEQKAAAERRAAGRPRKTGGTVPPVPRPKGKARDRVGAALGISGTQVDRLRKRAEMQAAVAGDNIRFGEVAELLGRNEIPRAWRAYKKLTFDPSKAKGGRQVTIQEPTEAPIGGINVEANSSRATALGETVAAELEVQAFVKSLDAIARRCASLLHSESGLETDQLLRLQEAAGKVVEALGGRVTFDTGEPSREEGERR